MHTAYLHQSSKISDSHYHFAGKEFDVDDFKPILKPKYLLI